MKRLIQTTVAGQVSSVSDTEIVINLHGNTMTLKPDFFQNVPNKNDEIYCEIAIFLKDKKETTAT